MMRVRAFAHEIVVDRLVLSHFLSFKFMTQAQHSTDYDGRWQKKAIISIEPIELQTNKNEQ